MTGGDTSARLSVGRILISLVATEAATGPYLADWNETHIYNPSWSPHAKFHNGQTMSMGVGLALATFWELWRKHDTLDDALRALDSASLSASLYWLTQISALSYPGARAVDPPGTARFPQWKFALPSLVIVALGNRLERRPKEPEHRSSPAARSALSCRAMRVSSRSRPVMTAENNASLVRKSRCIGALRHAVKR
jgi:hypothetical protein